MVTRDVASQPDISQITAQGAFKRIPSSFRNFIENGGKFEPERGMRFDGVAESQKSVLSHVMRQVATVFTFRSPVVSCKKMDLSPDYRIYFNYVYHI
jgi:hypothetical protein